MTHEIQAAIDVATRKKDIRSFRIGCAIRRRDGVLIKFSNSPCSLPTPDHHAEARCAKKATPDSVAYVVRVRRDGSLSMAKPCFSCRAKLRARGVRKVVYTQWDGSLESMDL